MTVLFGDIVGFTALSSKTSAAEIVEMLNGLFRLFDEVAQELGIEKIKTIGDCYMAVCGLPRPCSDHSDRMARMALRMLEATRQYAHETGLNLQLRIGLNSGPVVAGVIGATKFIYDLWGDTVNLASRMESTGVPGQIQVTRSVYERLKDSYEFESRGVVQVKEKERSKPGCCMASCMPSRWRSEDKTLRILGARSGAAAIRQQLPDQRNGGDRRRLHRILRHSSGAGKRAARVSNPLPCRPHGQLAYLR